MRVISLQQLLKLLIKKQEMLFLLEKLGQIHMI